MDSRRLVLASASPARLTLLRAAGFDPEVIPSEVEEDGIDDLSASDAARILAERKALAVAARLAGADAGESRPLVVGCDSILSVGSKLRGKPSSESEARRWWREHRGRTATLVTGQCVVALDAGQPMRLVSGVAATLVRFGRPSDEEIEAYLATGEPLQVAGAATIDGFGAPFIDGIEGDHGTVLGLSLPLLRDLLDRLGVAITDLWTSR